MRTRRVTRLAFGPVGIALALVACVNGHRGGDAMGTRTIEEVLRAHTGELMSHPGVVGTAQGLCAGRPCIKVYVAEKSPELAREIPSLIEGYPVEVEVTGEIRPLPGR